jgi:hypothetical protein
MALEAIPGAYAPASIILSVTGACKPPLHNKIIYLFITSLMTIRKTRHERYEICIQNFIGGKGKDGIIWETLAYDYNIKVDLNIRGIFVK